MSGNRTPRDAWAELPLFRDLQAKPGPKRDVAPGHPGNRRSTEADVPRGDRAPSSPESAPASPCPDRATIPPAPPGVHFGTSSWAYPGWFGHVYSRRYRSSGDTVAMLEAYARSPLFDCVGVDSSFYRPPSRERLARYAAAVPDHFTILGKVYERFTIRRFTNHRKWGTLAGRRNPDFLDPVQCTEQVVGPWLEVLGNHAGPLIFEFQTLYPPDLPTPKAWADTLLDFFERLPKQGRYAVEIRNPELLAPPYFDALRRAGAAHVFNAWTRMPAIGEQFALPGAFTADFVVVRALLRPGRSYRAAVHRFEPYDRIQDPQPAIRQDIVRVAQEAARTGRQVFILVNNRLEGHAPGTIEAIRYLLARAAEPADRDP